MRPCDPDPAGLNRPNMDLGMFFLAPVIPQTSKVHLKTHKHTSNSVNYWNIPGEMNRRVCPQITE